jgi:hypothetical protein
VYDLLSAIAVEMTGDDEVVDGTMMDDMDDCWEVSGWMMDGREDEENANDKPPSFSSLPLLGFVI